MRIVLFALAMLSLLVIVLAAMNGTPSPVSEVTFAVFLAGAGVVDAIERAIRRADERRPSAPIVEAIERAVLRADERHAEHEPIASVREVND